MSKVFIVVINHIEYVLSLRVNGKWVEKKKRETLFLPTCCLRGGPISKNCLVDGWMLSPLVTRLM